MAAPEQELFRFEPQRTNPELWRTTLPRIVHERCRGHKGLIATWRAIHWLITLHSATHRRAFGVREIAAEANVGRNELHGDAGYIQRLVQLDLIQIVGYERIPGLAQPRPIYNIDLWELERQSLALVPELLRQHHLPPPPRPAPDPRQLSFLDPPDAPATAPWPDSGPGVTVVVPAPTPAPPAWPDSGPEVPASGPASDAAGPATASSAPAWPDSGPVMHESGPAMHESGPVVPASGPATPLTRPALPETGPGLARDRAIEGVKEGAKERESAAPPPPISFESLVSATAQVVLEVLRQQQRETHASDPAPAPPPTAPAAAIALPGPILELWAAAGGSTDTRSHYQLEMLAGTFDAPSGGYGAYWLGRAILMADFCLHPKGQAVTLPYLKAILRRWQAEASWGSDLEDLPLPTPGNGVRPAPPPAAQSAQSAPSAQSADPSPALQAYHDAFGEAPNAVQAQQINATVTDLAAWQRVLTAWLSNGWKERSVAKMLDRYRKETGDPGVEEPSVSVATIHTYPGLADEERDHWIRRFHNAPTPAEKRAVLARLQKEHPR